MPPIPRPAGRTAQPSRAEAWTPPWMPRVIAGFVAVSVLLVVVFVAAGGSRGGIPWFVLSHVLSFAAFGYGASTARTGFRNDWNLGLCAVTVWVIGDLTGSAVIDTDGVVEGWQLGIALSTVAFALMTTAVWRLARRDGFVQGTSIALDAAIYGLGTALIWWTLVGQELVTTDGRLTPGAIVAALVPLGDGVLLAATASLMSSRAAHTLSTRALVVMCIAGLTGDIGFARYALDVIPTLPTWVPASWMVQFAAAGAAALASGRASMLPEHEVSPGPAYLATACLVTGPLVAVLAASGYRPELHLHAATPAVIMVGTLVVASLVAMRERRQVQRIIRQTEQMELTARTDHLTGLPNRRAGDRMLAAAIDRARTRPVGRLSVAILDLDRFKRYNDTYGHQSGDALLRDCAGAWTTTLSGLGTIFRYGGEEFVVILPSTPPDDAERVVEALRRSTPHGQSFSAGLVELRPEDDQATLLRRADESLYLAKQRGRARTVLAA